MLIKFPIASKQGFKLLFHKLLASVIKPLKKACICGIRSAKASLTQPITWIIKLNIGCPTESHTVFSTSTEVEKIFFTNVITLSVVIPISLKLLLILSIIGTPIVVHFSAIPLTKSIAPSTIFPKKVTTLVAIGSIYAPTVSVNSVIFDWVLLIWFA